MSISHCVRLPRDQTLKFVGSCLASVVALNHDDTVRRLFRVYDCSTIDTPPNVSVSASEHVSANVSASTAATAIAPVTASINAPINTTTYVAERIDDPDTINVRYWGAYCADELAVYDFFGNEPLANYLYGRLGFTIPGLQSVPL